MQRRAVLVAISLALLGGSGCATNQTREMVRLRKQLDRLAQKTAADQNRFEELNNRLFLLEDKVDTSRVAIERKREIPRLSVVRIRPEDLSEPPRAAPAPRRAPGSPGSITIEQDEASTAEEPDESAEAGGALPASHGKQLVTSRDIVYQGQATDDGPRPVLRLRGSEPGRIGQHKRARRGPGHDGLGDLPAASEKLPVVPLPPRSPAVAGAAKAKLPSAMNLYKAAMKHYRAGAHAEAIAGFRSFVERFPKHGYADNASYWLGECFYDKKDYRRALEQFRTVVEQHPGGNKAPDALLKMGYCFVKLKRQKHARSVLAQVVEIFPDSRVARLASATLAELN